MNKARATLPLRIFEKPPPTDGLPMASVVYATDNAPSRKILRSGAYLVIRIQRYSPVAKQIFLVIFQQFTGTSSTLPKNRQTFEPLA